MLNHALDLKLPLQCCSLLIGLIFCPTTGISLAEEASSQDSVYEDVVAFLVQHTQVMELTNESGARVAVCPEFQGRVMTSTCEGPQGMSLGWINRAFIKSGQSDPHFNNYGGEDRFWLAPEGGQFALWFADGAEQTLENWLTPPAFNTGAFERVGNLNLPGYRFRRRMRITNASSTEFDLNVERYVRLLSAAAFTESFGAKAGKALGNGSTKMVGFETQNKVTNQGSAHSRDTGLISIWTLGMFPPSEETVVIAPYQAGPEDELGPIVNGDYFGPVPGDRLVVTPSAVLFRADGNYRSKIGLTPARAKPVVGSIDFTRGVLTLVHYTVPDNAKSEAYVNNTWVLPQPAPYSGDALNSYNDGPPEPGAKSLGGFYELETLSPAKELATGDEITHIHQTFHIRGSIDNLADLAKLTLGVELDEIRKAMHFQ